MTQKKQDKLWQDSRNIGWAITLCAAGVILSTLSVTEFKDVWKRDRFEAVLSLVLFVSTFGWFVLYLYTPLKEMNILNDCLTASQVATIELRPFLLIITIGILFGVLIGTPVYVTTYSIVVTAMNISDIIAAAIILQYMYSALETSSTSLLTKNRPALVIFRYYALVVAKDILTLILYFSSVLFNCFFYFTKLEFFNYCSYVLLIIPIWIGELIIRNLRRSRDSCLKRQADVT